jgi:peptide/nickel transport system substrate-binding protein
MRVAAASLITLALLALHAAPGSAVAAALTIDVQADTPSLDPHVAPAQTSESIRRHIYDTLVQRDPDLHSAPALATRWTMLDDTHWRFTLRADVHFSDGAPLTPADVVASLLRPAHLQNAAGTYASYTRTIKSVTVSGADQVDIETRAPDPQLIDSVSRVAILSAKNAEVGAADFASGAAAIGTGPYVATSWRPGEHLGLARNPRYWGEAPEWDSVTIHPVPDDAARLAALLSGDADLVDKVPLTDVVRLRGDARVHVVVHDGDRAMFLVPAMWEQGANYATDAAGAKLTPPPMRDPRVRRALALAINRRALLDRLMGGLGSSANQIVPPGMFGFADTLPAIPFDPAGARALLAQAGFPQGFNLTLHCSNGRYVNDRETCQAVGQMLARISIRTDVEAEPQSVFYARLTRLDFSLALNGWGSDTGDSIAVLRQAVHSVDPAHGLGAFNRGHYASAGVDALIERAMMTSNDAERASLQRQAMRQAMDEFAVIPLYTSAWAWGVRKGLDYQGGFEEGTLAMRASRAP